MHDFHPRLHSVRSLRGIKFVAAGLFLLGCNLALAAELLVAGLFPAANATGVSPDTPLKIIFGTTPTLAASGKIQIFDASTNAVVETIEVGGATPTRTIGGREGYRYYPVIITGREAAIYLQPNALAYNQSYYVKIDAGVFSYGTAANVAIDQPATWRFTTRAAAPAAGLPRLTVAADGTGDFCTLQAALDFIPDGNTAPVTIFLKKGTYTEIICFSNKHSLTLLGEDRKETVIAYANNTPFSGGNGNNPNSTLITRPGRGAAPAGAPGTVAAPGATGTPARGAAGGAPANARGAGGNAAAGGRGGAGGGGGSRRGMFIATRCNDLTIANLTMRNTSPHGNGPLATTNMQAEAIILGGTPTSHAIIKDVDFYSYQDTVQINGQAYISNCYIEGDVDFMWGNGPSFFDQCTVRTVTTGAYFTQIRNPATNRGFIYHKCTFEGSPGVTDNYLSRIEPGRFPYSEVVLLDCIMDKSVLPVAWLLDKNRDDPNDPIDASKVHFWEYNSHDITGKPVDVSQRISASRQLKLPQDAALIADYSNPVWVLGGNWDPKQAPIFKK